MKFAILIYGDEAVGAQATPEQIDQSMGEWWGYEAELQKKEGLRLAGEALQPTPTAKSVRVKDGKSSVTDGPFAETKEQLGGVYLLDVKDEGEAIEWAIKCPGAKTGTVEVRAVQEFEPPQ
jgi:hypothetical protein